MPEKIKMLRKEKKWSQDNLSRAINIHSKHISRYEKGKTILGPETLKKIVNVFSVSTDYLMNDDVPRNEKIKIDDPELLEQFEVIGQLKPGSASSNLSRAGMQLSDGLFIWRARLDSNQRSSAPEADALSPGPRALINLVSCQSRNLRFLSRADSFEMTEYR